jgi:hypothetical protein
VLLCRRKELLHFGPHIHLHDQHSIQFPFPRCEKRKAEILLRADGNKRLIKVWSLLYSVTYMSLKCILTLKSLLFISWTIFQICIFKFIRVKGGVLFMKHFKGGGSYRSFGTSAIGLHLWIFYFGGFERHKGPTCPFYCSTTSYPVRSGHSDRSVKLTADPSPSFSANSTFCVAAPPKRWAPSLQQRTPQEETDNSATGWEKLEKNDRVNRK